MKRQTKVLGAVVLLLCLAVGWPVAAHYRLKARLEAYRRQLQAQGEKLTIVELTPVVPSDAAWSGTALQALAGRLRTLVPNFTNQAPTMQMVAPGRAIAAAQQEPLPTAEVRNVWPGLRADLATNQAVLAQAHSVVQAPCIAVSLDYSQGFNMLLPHLAQFKSVSQWLLAETTLALHEHRTNDAVESLNSLVALVQHYQAEPTIISTLVRIAMGALGVSATWEALQSPDLSEPQLLELQRAWASVDLLTNAEGALAMERAMGRQLFDRGRISFNAISSGVFGTAASGSALSELAQMGKEVLENPKEGLNNLARRYPGYWKWKCWQSYEDELVRSQGIQAGLETLRAVQQQAPFGPALQRLDQQVQALQQAHPSAGSWLGSEMALNSGVHGVLLRLETFELQRSLTLAAIALKRYHLRHGAYPAQLSALAPDFLSQVPRDPMDGQPLRYRLNSDGSFLLYSVGPDNVDNGGDATPATDPKSKRWLQGRDIVWPSLASPEQKQAYYNELAAKRDPPSPANADEVFRRRYGIRSAPVSATNAPSH